jgi:hypothetical protein
MRRERFDHFDGGRAGLDEIEAIPRTPSRPAASIIVGDSRIDNCYGACRRTNLRHRIERAALSVP